MKRPLAVFSVTMFVATVACAQQASDEKSKSAVTWEKSAPRVVVAQADASKAAAPASSDKPYKVVDGTKVDHNTMEGFRAWRAAACDRCHGPNQEGMVGPSLITSLKTLTKEQFKTTVTSGRLEKGMPSFQTNEQVVKNLDNLYIYLKGRSDGAITKAKVEEIQ
jgi:mono/diheme cytochrome c family protein